MTVIETFEQYDIPGLFSCKNSSGQHYLALSAHEDIYASTWFYLPVSNQRLDKIRFGKTDIYEAYLTAEDGFVFEVIISPGGDATTVKSLPCSDIQEDWLPHRGKRLSVPENMSAQHMAKITRRDILEFVFDFPDSFESKVPSRILGDILITTQELFDSIGSRNYSSTPPMRGPISKDILVQTKMSINQVFQGTFDIQLIADQKADENNSSLIGEAIGEFTSLTQAISDGQLLKEKLVSLRGRILTKYAAFLKAIKHSGSDFKCNWGSPKEGSGGTASVNNQEARNVLSIIRRLTKKALEDKKAALSRANLNVAGNQPEVTKEKALSDRESDTDL
ncbi:hypothetical protein QUF72_15025 [Desulfobacterales bacterium HSG2]|nr:hypothetical protein [Desulfobacterales bacterium HSG2]